MTSCVDDQHILRHICMGSRSDEPYPETFFSALLPMATTYVLPAVSRGGPRMSSHWPAHVVANGVGEHDKSAIDRREVSNLSQRGIDCS